MSNQRVLSSLTKKKHKIIKDINWLLLGLIDVQNDITLEENDVMNLSKKIRELKEKQITKQL